MAGGGQRDSETRRFEYCADGKGYLWRGQVSSFSRRSPLERRSKRLDGGPHEHLGVGESVRK